jgi:arylsulfatase A-like enzyme/Tfp pilus assembly protein PilF
MHLRLELHRKHAARRHDYRARDIYWETEPTHASRDTVSQHRPRRPAGSRRSAPRRAPIRILLVLLLVAAAAVAAWQFAARRTRFPALARTADQNVLLITIDTLRADALGSYGGRAETPNLDRLAASGVRFTFAHGHAVVTLPSHASVMTGRYPFEHGVRDNAGFRLGEAAVTLAEAARQKGFATGAFVGAFPLDRQFGLAQGFDVYDDLGGRGVLAADFAFSERPAAEVVSAARAWIERQQKPWLAWVHVFDPHSPYAPPPPFDARYSADAYAGEVAYVDATLGQLLDLARRSTRKTTIVVTADHGEGLGDHGEPTHGVFAYESTLRVPLILAQTGPGVVERADSVTSDVPVRHVDILPTIADLTLLDIPTDLPGRTLLAARDGEEDPRPTYFEAMTTMLKRGWAPLRGVIVDRHKYIDLPLEELYDLASDTAETQNRAASAADRARTLAARLNGFGATLPGEQGEENAETRARLQSLGYVSGTSPRKARYGEEDDPKRLIDVDRLMIQGIELHRAGRTTDAVAAYRQVIARRPDMGLAYRRLAFIQWESGATADAIATLRHALEKNGPDIEIEIRVGTYLAETGTPDLALRMLERVVTAEPENVDALNALGIAQARSGKDENAMRTFERILTIDSRNVFALENLGAVHLQRRDMRAAAAAFTRAAAHDPRSSRAEAGLGVVAFQEGRQDAAIEHWRRAVDLDRTNFDALFNLATELLNAGRSGEARPYVDRFVRTAPPALYGAEIARFRRVLSGGGVRPGSDRGQTGVGPGSRGPGSDRGQTGVRPGSRGPGSDRGRTGVRPGSRGPGSDRGQIGVRPPGTPGTPEEHR